MTMMTKPAVPAKRTPVAMNGVDTPKLLATINVVGGFLVTNRMLEMFRRK